MPKSKRRLRLMKAGEAPEVEMALPPLRLTHADFIEAMGAPCVRARGWDAAF